jgi:site-specific DNA recombinase
LPRLLSWDGVGWFRGDAEAWTRPHLTDVLDVPANTISMKRELTLLLKRRVADAAATPNKRLVGLLRKARAAQRILDDRRFWTVTDLAAEVGCHAKRFTRLVRLNYLAPDIIASILDGTQPPKLDCRSLMAADLPMDWALQRRLLGFPDQPDFLRVAPGW